MAKGKTAQDFVPVKEVRDGVIIMENGSLKRVLMASSLNLALKSYDEQVSILMQFQNFLNTLDFTVQIYVQSRKFDIRPYIAMLDEQKQNQLNDLLRVQTEEYMEFIRNFSDQVNIMEKSFFIIVPYAPPTLTAGGGGMREKIGAVFPFVSQKKKGTTEQTDFEANRSQLDQRAYIVDQGLIRSGIRTQILGTEEVVELLYRLFNPGETEKPIPVQ